MKPQDEAAASIRFGIELETVIPISSHIEVGAYHRGLPVTLGTSLTGQRLEAPRFGDNCWRADRDGSIRAPSGYMPCEFVSPVLCGREGLSTLCEFVVFLNQIGAKVNDSCGCHITIGIESVIGSSDPAAVSEFVRKLAHISQWHARSLYGQTGTGRHLNTYCQTMAADVERHLRSVCRHSSVNEKQAAATACGRGMLNFLKVFRSYEDHYVGAMEFRLFAGTTNLHKILHHLGSVLGLCRRAHEVRCLGAFRKNRLQVERTRTAMCALRFLWDYLGWRGSARPVALGLFGRLHSDFRLYKTQAIRLCERFDAQFPDAAL